MTSDALPPDGGIVIGVCVGPGRRYASVLEPTIARHCPDAAVLVREGQRSIAAAYNSIAAEAVGLGATGVIFLHDDVELREDPRPAFASCVAEHPDAAVVGVVGSIGARFHWWPDGEPRGRTVDPFQSHDYGGGTHRVDVVDGLFLGLSRWALDNLRFDSSIGAWHGYDSDLAWQARAAGRSVYVTDVSLFHHSRPMSAASQGEFETARFSFYLKWHPNAPRHRRLAWRLLRTPFGQRLRSGIAFVRSRVGIR